MDKHGERQEAEPVLKVQDICVRFGQKEILKKIRLDILEGEVFGIIGMSGSGKTTLLSTIIGAIQPNSGDVLFRSNRVLQGLKYQSVFQNQFAVRNLMGFSTQRPSFYPELTVQQNMDYFAALYDLPPDLAEENIKRALKLVGLHGFENLEARFLSGGMQKKLDIACAIIHNPSILILDEPTADLDPVTRAELLRLFKRINSEGKTIIIASHFLSELEYFCNRIAILNNGVIADIGSVEQLSKRISANKEIHLQTAKGNYSIIIEKLKKVRVVEISQIVDKGHKLIIYTPSAEHLLQHILQAVRESEDSILNINVTRPSLNDVFKQVVKKR
ncbi:MAG: ABC transporter ATP-binding protein [Candidatus Woesearchaeota archaeon]